LYASPFTFGRRETKLEDADYAILGVPYDSSQSYRVGSRLAPLAIREASREIEDYDMLESFDLLDLKICDLGDVEVSPGDFNETLQRTEKSVKEILRRKVVPIIIGGEHTVSYCILKAYESPPLYIVLDAHLDFRDEYLNNKFSHACTVRRVGELLGYENILAIGIRSASKGEINDARRLGLQFLDFNQCKSLQKAAETISRRTEGKDIYLSIDADVLDPREARGVSNPEPPGLTYGELLEFIRALENAKLVGMDLVEICPLYDSYTPILGAKIIFKVLEIFGRPSKS
jgi:agmatinase